MRYFNIERLTTQSYRISVTCDAGFMPALLYQLSRMVKGTAFKVPSGHGVDVFDGKNNDMDAWKAAKQLHHSVWRNP